MKHSHVVATQLMYRLFHPFRLAFVATLCIFSVACSTPRPIDQRTPSWARDLGKQQASGPTVSGKVDETQRPTSTPPPVRPDNSFYSPGTGELIGTPTTIAEAAVDDGEIKLNFQNANLLEVVKVVLGDMLGATYVIDPRVQGAVTMQTSRPLTRADLIPTLELLLRMNEAALVMDGDIYRVMPVTNAVTGVRAPQLGDSALPLPRGYSVRVVPLNYVAAEEMAQILEPFIAGGNNLLRTDTQRNAIILAGSADDMARLIETIRVFDVDRMRGMSVAMFTPDFVDAETLGEELEAVLADPEQGLMSGLVRIVVIERLNGVMVITPRPEYLAQVRTWIRRLDRETGTAGRRLFVYRVQNANAVDLAETLNELYDADSKDKTPPAELAPGLTPTTARSAPGDQEGDAQTTAPAAEATTPGAGVRISEDAKVKVIADEPNNALVILASAQEYRQILSSLEQLDAVPMQVLVDVTIAEVTLSDDLRYGVEWFINNNLKGGARVDSSLRFNSALDNLQRSNFSGFTFLLTGDNGALVLNMLAEETNLSILSSPSLLVLNNQEASIFVGEDVPVQTQAQQGTSEGDRVLTSIDYREAGVRLDVKPRVNAGGLVIMQVSQESSRRPLRVDPRSETSLTPEFQTREVESVVAVQSGDTIILGGLIQDEHDQSERGVPGLHTLPFLGALFGTKADGQRRTELLVLITPRAVLDRNTALQLTEEYRRKLNSLIPIEQGRPTSDAAPPAAEPEPPKTAPPAEPSPQAGRVPASKPLEAYTAIPAADPGDPGGGVIATACERIGPFSDATVLQDFRRQHADIRFLDLPETLAEAPYAHQVVTNVYPSSTQAYATADRLKAAGIRETLVYQQGPSANAVSLGVFSSLQNAQMMATRAAKMGIDTQVKPRTKTIQHHWTLIRRRPTGPPLNLPPGVLAAPVPCPAQAA